MKNLEIKVGAPTVARNLTISVPFPETVEEAVKEYGADVVLKAIEAEFKVSAQAAARTRMIKVGDDFQSDETIVDAMEKFVFQKKDTATSYRESRINYWFNEFKKIRPNASEADLKASATRMAESDVAAKAAAKAAEDAAKAAMLAAMPDAEDAE